MKIIRGGHGVLSKYKKLEQELRSPMHPLKFEHCLWRYMFMLIYIRKLEAHGEPEVRCTSTSRTSCNSFARRTENTKRWSRSTTYRWPEVTTWLRRCTWVSLSSSGLLRNFHRRWKIARIKYFILHNHLHTY